VDFSKKKKKGVASVASSPAELNDFFFFPIDHAILTRQIKKKIREGGHIYFDIRCVGEILLVASPSGSLDYIREKEIKGV
jgi:hypothetical protein